MSSNPFEEPESPAPKELYARPGDGGEFYYWLGQEYKRATSFLDSHKGNHLAVWMAEQAVMSAVAPLVHAGLYVPDCDTVAGLKLEAFVDGRPMRQLSPAEAIAETADIDFHKLEGHRYRDYKAGLGQLEHHAAYEFALAGRNPFREVDIIDWAMATARDLKVFGPAAVARFEACGKSLEDAERDLAFAAKPHIERKFEWNNLYLPEWNMIGKGVAVFSKTDDGLPLSAGTPDEDFYLSRAVWEKVGKFRWPFGDNPRPRILNDDKNSNTEDQVTHLYQVGGYARHDFIGCYDDKSVHEIPDFDAIAISYISPEGVNFWAFNGRDKIDHFGAIFFAMVNLHFMMQGRPSCERRTKYVAPKPVKGSRPCPIAIGGS